MNLSGYKVEAFLNDFRKRYGYKQVASHRVDALEISQEAQYEAYRVWSYVMKRPKDVGWVTPQNIWDLVADRSVFAPAVEYEQQRRAGLFVNPVYVPPNPPPRMELVHDHVGEFQAAYEAEQGSALTSPEVFSSTSSASDTASSSSSAGTHASSTFSESQPATASSKSSQASIPTDVNFEEDLGDIDFLDEEEDERWSGETSVVYGSGRIRDEAMVEFIHTHPDSTLKFLFRRELDGKPPQPAVEEVYETWQKRGLSRKKIKDYILALMEWSEFPDSPLYDIWSDLRDRLYELSH